MRKLLIHLITLGFVLTTVGTAIGAEIVVYTARNEHLIRPLFEAYSDLRGTKIKYVTGKAPVLLQRLKAEGKNSPADILMTVDAGNLWHAAREGVLQPVDSPILNKNIPVHLKDPGNRWFGLSVRARTIVYSTKRVNPAQLKGYADLADPVWKGRLILRTAKKVYNQSLVAMLIREHGNKETARIVKGWVNNLAAAPFSSDTKVLQAIEAGQGDVGIVNTYYFGRLLRKNPDLPLALFWPDQHSSGVHVNVSGAGLTHHSKNRAEAVHLLEWLSTEPAQRMLADGNLEYPANPTVEPHASVSAWGTFKQNRINLQNAGAYQTDAIRLMDRAGYKTWYLKAAISD